MEFPRKSPNIPRVIVTKGKLYTASDSEDSDEDRIGQHEPRMTRTRKAKRMAWRRIRHGTGSKRSPGFAEGSESGIIGFAGEENGNGHILASIPFNPEHDDSAVNEAVTRKRNPWTSSNFGVWVKRSRHDALVQHERTHVHTGENPHQCNVCGKTFSKKSFLVTHTRTHTGEKPSLCSVCGKTFSRRLHLVKHTRGHIGEKPHQCSVCGKTFSQRSTLMTHTRTHAGEKPHRCSVCGKTFIKRSHLVIHTRTHTGEKPHQCSVCGKTFRLRSHLVTHTRTHTGEKPHQCSVCGKTFSQRSTLVMHTRTHTGEKPHQCSVCVEKPSVKGLPS